jgi:hypothetical protein
LYNGLSSEIKDKKMTTRKERIELEAIDKLLHVVELKPGDTIYTRLDHVSRSGMYRVISLFVMRDNEPWNISHMAAPLLEGYDEKHEGCKASGCGMDMGWHLVYNLSRQLFKDNFDCIGKGCPANDHANGDRLYESHKHSDGGYALKQRWL